METNQKNSIKKNYIFNVIYQVFVLIVPLITTPYISRVLLAEGVGQYSYTYSIVNYFVLVAALGFGVYGQREIAKHQNDKRQQGIILFEILIVRFFSVGISLLTFIILCLTNVFNTYTSLMWWWLVLIIAQEFDITFFFQGNEQFGKVVIRNIIIKIASVILIFILVKKQDDVWIYILCFAGSTFLGNLSLWFYLPKSIERFSLKEIHPCKHIIPTIRLFIPTIATSLYTVLDKTLIGLLIQDTYIVTENQVIDGVVQPVEVVKKYSDLENGYYEQAEKLVKLSMTIIIAMGTVMIPRNSNEYAVGNLDKVKDNIYFSSRFVYLLGIPIMLGFAAIANNFIPWFLGEGYGKSILLIQIFSPLVLIIGFSNVFGLQYLIPTKRDLKYTIAILIGAGSNLILNLILIPLYWSFGAVIASITAELLVTLCMAIFIHKEISLLKIIKISIKYIISGAIMFVGVFFTARILSSSILNTMLLVLEGVGIYGICLLILKEEFCYNIVKKIIHKLIKSA